MWNNFGNYFQPMNFSYEYPSQDCSQPFNMYPILFNFESQCATYGDYQLFLESKQ